MGFFDRFFKPKIEEKEVNIKKLKPYADELLKDKLENINKKIEEYYHNIEEAKSKIGKNLKILSEAELQNKNVPTRALQMMEGNRDAYIKKINKFFEDIELPDMGLYSTIKNFCINFDLRLSELNKSTFKGYEIMKEFFYNQAVEVAMNIREINENIKNLKKVVDNDELSKIENLKRFVDNIDKYNENKKKITEEIEEQKKKIENINEKIENVKKKFDEIKKSKEFEEYRRTDEEKELIIQKIKNEKDEITQLFAILERSLRKYKRGSLNEKIIEEYLEDPNEALIKDNDLEILKVLESLKRNIEENKVELKDKKKEKTLDAIKILKKEFIDEKRDKLEQHTRTKIIFNERLRKNNINYLYQEEKYKIEHFIKKLEEEKHQLEKLEKEKEDIDFEKLKENIKKEFFNLFNIKLNIS